jgi:hypothetical protein
MPRYIKIPQKPAQLVDTKLDVPARRPKHTPTGAPVLDEEGNVVTELFLESHPSLFRLLFGDQRIWQLLDAGSLFDLRGQLVNAKPGAWEKVTEDEWQALCAAVRRPTVYRQEFLFSPDGQAFLRAILDAPTSIPTKGAKA